MSAALTACSSIPSQPKPSSVLTGIQVDGSRLYFADTEEEIKKEIENYAAIYDILSLEGQMDYLLSRMLETKLTLIRNSTQYYPRHGTEFLRWKVARPRFENKIHSARDFVHLITSGSKISGLPYLVITADGDVHNLEYIFTNELELLEQHEVVLEKRLLVEKIS